MVMRYIENQIITYYNHTESDFDYTKFDLYLN